MKERLVYIRAKSDQVPPLHQRLVRVLVLFLLGAILGFFAKLIGGSVAEVIGNYLGFGAVVTTIIAVRSRSPIAAGLHVFILLTAMLIAYYMYSMVLGGFFSKDYFIDWSCIVLLSPIAGYVVWYAKGNGWRASFCAAAPIGLLLAEGRGFFYTFSVSSGFDLFAAILLYIILPANHFQRLRMLPIVTVLFFLIEWIGAFNYLPGS